MNIKLYIYNKSDNSFMYEDIGSIDLIMYDLGDDKDFTLTPPPDHEHTWHWIDDKWTTNNTAN